MSNKNAIPDSLTVQRRLTCMESHLGLCISREGRDVNLMGFFRELKLFGFSDAHHPGEWFRLVVHADNQPAYYFHLYMSHRRGKNELVWMAVWVCMSGGLEVDG